MASTKEEYRLTLVDPDTQEETVFLGRTEDEVYAKLDEHLEDVDIELETVYEP